MNVFGTSSMFIFRSVNDCLKIIWVTLVVYILGNFYISGVSWLSTLCKKLCCLVQTVDFLDNLLRYDHQERLTAREAMVSTSLLFACIL
jgi:hypothetical protein